MGRIPIHPVDNPHSVTEPYYRKSYWRDGAACGVHDEWTHVRVAGLRGNWPEFTYTPLQRYDLDRLLAFLQSAYERGVEDKAREIRKVLGIADNRG